MLVEGNACTISLAEVDFDTYTGSNPLSVSVEMFDAEESVDDVWTWTATITDVNDNAPAWVTQDNSQFIVSEDATGLFCLSFETWKSMEMKVR